MPAKKATFMAFVPIILLLSSGACCAQRAQFIAFNNTSINYEGRIGTLANAKQLYWAGSAINMVFTGSSAWAKMDDEKGSNYYTIVVDGDTRKIPLVTGEHLYKLCDSLPNIQHTVTVFKSTQWDKGSTMFYGFMLNAGARLLDWANTKTRAIEFYGNSITCGSAMEDSPGYNSGEAKFENNYLSYAAITARHYNAAYHCIARSGIGLMVSWYHMIMPEMYNRLNPNDANSQWDFTQYNPGIVVVNLLQNDSWIAKLPSNKQFKQRFGKRPPSAGFIISAYKQFIISLRNKYPHANIICTLGSMDAVGPGSPWPRYIQKAVGQMHSDKISTFFFPYKNTPGHPGVNEQQQMADSLIRFIDGHITW